MAEDIGESFGVVAVQLAEARRKTGIEHASAFIYFTPKWESTEAGRRTRANSLGAMARDRVTLFGGEKAQINKTTERRSISCFGGGSDPSQARERDVSSLADTSANE